jgi:TPR repeat protein
MHLRISAFLIALALAGCASTATRESSYNEGVYAFRAKDYRTAREKWAKAIDEGETSALNNLGYLLFQGLGGPVDKGRAIELWRRAATAGHSESQWHLGHAYESGAGVEQSYVEAYAWYRCSVATAESGAQNDSTQAEVLRDASKSLTRLLQSLPPDQFASAEALAREYIAMYSRRRTGA